MDLKAYLRAIPDFPRAGITFIDITTLFKDGQALGEAIRALVEQARQFPADLVVAPEARGFMVGAPIAYALGLGFVPVRKPGKLPAATLRGEYELEYGTSALEIHQDAIRPGTRVLVVDDLLATGGTARAGAELVERLGGVVTACLFLIELVALGGRERLAPRPVRALIPLEGK